ncbi:hypothetical protein Tco_0153015 [Tanacetum coccineum]
MDTTRAQQQALDDELVAPADQIYMQEFWVTISRHHSSLCFKLNGKSHTVNVDNFRDMLKICPKLHGQIFEEPPLEERRYLSLLENLDTLVYGAILPQHLTNHAMLESEAYMTYHAYATSEKTSKLKSTKKKANSESSPETKLTQASKGKRIKTVAKGDKPAKKKQFITKSKGLTVLSEVALTEAEQIKLATKRSLIPGVPDVPTYKSDDEQISWKSSEKKDDERSDANDANQDDDDEQTDSDNDGDDFVHPKFSTHDDEARQYDEVNEEESDEESDDGSNEDSDEEMQLPNVQGTQVMEDTHVIITAPINPEGQQQSSSMSSGFISNMLNPSPDTGIDIIFTPNTEATSLVDVPVTTIAEPPLLSATTLPPTPLITHLQQTPVPTPATVPSSSLQDLPNFGSLFGLRDEAQAKNADFLNKLDDNIKKIIKDQVKEQVKAQVSKILPKIEKTVNEQLEAEVMTRSSTESKKSLSIAANLSKLELKKILIDKMKSNKSIHISDEQKNLYKALVDAYESDKLILDTYGDTVL